MKKLWKILGDYGIITLSCLLYAFSFNCFFQPNSLAMGGFTGFAQVLNRLIPVLPIGTMVFAMNVPLMIIGVKKQGWGLLFSSVYAISVSSVMIDTMAALVEFPTMDPLLACIYGGVLMGVSLGLMMLKNATTGGTELAARLLKYVIRNLSIGKLCLAIDVTVVSFYALTFRNLDSALYGVVAMYVCSIAMDMVVYGSVNAKLAYIISDHAEEITQRLMQMELGGTILNGKGAFTGNDKNVIMCAAKPAKIAKIKALVAEIDPEKAFVIVTDAKEVYGEGFGEHGENSL
ncbi:MAG: YitT family protein [Oscillospiraceae bacterium]|nr:YitT family protein [Oscillospiraceae bacterium]